MDTKHNHQWDRLDTVMLCLILFSLGMMIFWGIRTVLGKL